MSQHGIHSRRRPKRRVRTTDSQDNRPVAPNLLKRDFSADAPNEKWVGDIDGIWTDEGWVYLAALLNTYSRLNVGWAMSDYHDEALVETALRIALARRKLPDDSNLIQHKDRGSQYTADDYLALLKKHHIQVSMSGKADLYNNA
jgi:putative transposase